MTELIETDQNVCRFFRLEKQTIILILAFKPFNKESNLKWCYALDVIKLQINNLKAHWSLKNNKVMIAASFKTYTDTFTILEVLKVFAWHELNEVLQ